MMRLKSLLGIIVAVAVLSAGLLSISGCAATEPPGIPVIQPTPTPVAPTTTTAVVPTTTTAVVPTTTTAVVPTTTTAVAPTTTTPVAPTTTTVVVPTTTTPVVTPPPAIQPTLTPTIQPTPTQNKQALLADIRSKADQPSPGIYYVDAVTAKTLSDAIQVTFVDARYLIDYNTIHIAGAISYPIFDYWPPNSIAPETVLPDKEAIVITYCSAGCPASLELAEGLYTHGYHNLFVLTGGYYYWDADGYPMVKR